MASCYGCYCCWEKRRARLLESPNSGVLCFSDFSCSNGPVACGTKRAWQVATGIFVVLGIAGFALFWSVLRDGCWQNSDCLDLHKATWTAGLIMVMVGFTMALVTSCGTCGMCWFRGVQEGVPLNRGTKDSWLVAAGIFVVVAIAGVSISSSSILPSPIISSSRYSTTTIMAYFGLIMAIVSLNCISGMPCFQQAPGAAETAASNLRCGTKKTWVIVTGSFVVVFIAVCVFTAEELSTGSIDSNSYPVWLYWALAASGIFLPMAALVFSCGISGTCCFRGAPVESAADPLLAEAGDDDAASQIPAEFAKLGRAAIQVYNAEMMHGKKRISRVKLMFVGQGRVGKTCLLNNLTNRPHDPDELTTDGTDICVVEATDWVQLEQEPLYPLKFDQGVASSVGNGLVNHAKSEQKREKTRPIKVLVICLVLAAGGLWLAELNGAFSPTLPTPAPPSAAPTPATTPPTPVATTPGGDVIALWSAAGAIALAICYLIVRGRIAAAAAAKPIGWLPAEPTAEVLQKMPVDLIMEVVNGDTFERITFSAWDFAGQGRHSMPSTPLPLTPVPLTTTQPSPAPPHLYYRNLLLCPFSLHHTRSLHRGVQYARRLARLGNIPREALFLDELHPRTFVRPK
jgi:GTPase SAR1 family protein